MPVATWGGLRAALFFASCSAAEQRAQERHGDAPLRGEAFAVEAVEQRAERGEVAAGAAEQVVEHRVVELQAAPRRALHQRLAATGVVERDELHARALAQARGEVRQRELQFGGRGARGVEQRAA